MPLKKVFITFIYVFMCVALLPVAVAYAAQAEVEITVTPVPAVLDGPGQVTLDVKVRVLNGDAYSSITDFGIYLDSLELCSIPAIAAGEVVQQKLAVPVTISAQQLNKPIELRCFYRDFDGENRMKAVTFTVRSNATSGLTVTRAVSPQDAAVGSAVSITYTVKNVSGGTLSDIRLYDTVVSPTEPIAMWKTLEAGEGMATSAAVVVQTGMQSKPYATFISTEGASERVELEALQLHAAVEKLTVTLTADKALINAGEAVTLTCTLLNEGTVAYRDITITGETLGDLPGKTLLEPGQSYGSTKKIAPVSTGDYTVTATAKTADGKAVTVTSEPLTITVADSVPQTPVTMDLRITAVPTVTQVTQSDQVTVDITVRNASTLTLRDVVIKEASLGEVERLDSLPPGIDKFVKFEADIKATTTLNFSVEARTDTGSLVINNAAPVTITLAAGALEPTPYVWAETTPEAQTTPVPVYDGGTSSGATGMLLALLVIIGVLIVVCVIALIALWIRDRRRQNDEPPDGPYDDYGDDDYQDLDDDSYGDSEPTRAKEAPTRYDDRTRAVRRKH